MKHTYHKPTSNTINIDMRYDILAASRLPVIDETMNGSDARSNHSSWSSEDWTNEGADE